MCAKPIYHELWLDRLRLSSKIADCADVRMRKLFAQKDGRRFHPQSAQPGGRRSMCADLCVDWLAQGHDLRSPATICGKHLVQTEVEICADISMCRGECKLFVQKSGRGFYLHSAQPAGADQCAQTYV